MYKNIWMPGIDEALLLEKEPRNLHDNFTISIVKNEHYAGAHSQHSTRPWQSFENRHLLLYRACDPRHLNDTMAIRDNTVVY